MIRRLTDGAAQAFKGTAVPQKVAVLEQRIEEIEDRFLAAGGAVRRALVLEYMALKEALEDAREGRVIGGVTRADCAS